MFVVAMPIRRRCCCCCCCHQCMTYRWRLAAFVMTCDYNFASDMWTGVKMHICAAFAYHEVTWLQDIGGGAFTAPASTQSGKPGCSGQPLPDGQTAETPHGTKSITDAALQEWRNCVSQLGPDASETPRGANRINSISQFFRT